MLNRTNTRHSDSLRLLCLALCAVAALLATLTLLPGCGGNLGAPTDASPGASPSPTSADTASPPAPSPPSALSPIEVSASLTTVKRLTIGWSWPLLAQAQRALVLQDPDGDGPLPAQPPLADVPAADGTATVEIFLPDALQASYRVALCNDHGCTHSEPVRLQGSLERGMGRFKADAPRQNAEFGVSLALSEDASVMAVGDTTGDVHLFERSGPGRWISRGPVPAPSPAPGRLFDQALALSADGKVLAFGATGVGPSGGAAYVYRRQGDQWLFERHLRGSDVGPEDAFGSAVALSADGHTLAVGARWDDGPGDTRWDDGAVYVFTESGGNWTQAWLLRDSSSTPEEWFGASLALNADGTVLAVGSPYNNASGLGVHAAPIDDANAPGSGAVYLYSRLLGNWSLDAFIKPPMDLGTGAFGSAVVLDAQGNTLVVGAREADTDPSGVVDFPTYSYSGSAHVFARSGGQWSVHGTPLRSPAPRRDDEFGRSVALSADGQTVVIGTPFSDHSGLGVSTTESPIQANDAGSAYVFRRHANGWGTATVLQPGDHSSTGDRDVRLGSAVAISGDGRTVAVGARSHGGPGAGVSSDPAIAYGDDPGFALSGAVFLY